MANDIDKTSPHYKGEFGSIYEVNQKFPSGGVAGDYVAIDGWAHYWNADRGTWCVNAQRDSYWDELITNLGNALKILKGATYVGMASPSLKPDAFGGKVYYFATESGIYTYFGNISVPQGISILYSDNGNRWSLQNLLEVSQKLGQNSSSVISQKVLTDELGKKATASDVSAALQKKADIETMNEAVSQINTKNKLQDTEISKKADMSDVNLVANDLSTKIERQDEEISKKANMSDVNLVVKDFSSKIEWQNEEISRKANQTDVDANFKIVNSKNLQQDREIDKKAEKSDIDILKDLIRAATGMPQDLLDKMVEYNEVLEKTMPILRNLREITEEDIDRIINDSYVPQPDVLDQSFVNYVQSIDEKASSTKDKLDDFIDSNLTPQQVEEVLDE